MAIEKTVFLPLAEARVAGVMAQPLDLRIRKQGMGGGRYEGIVPFLRVAHPSGIRVSHLHQGLSQRPTAGGTPAPSWPLPGLGSHPGFDFGYAGLGVWAGPMSRFHPFVRLTCGSGQG